jgi:hypothetical protein
MTQSHRDIRTRIRGFRVRPGKELQRRTLRDMMSAHDRSCAGGSDAGTSGDTSTTSTIDERMLPRRRSKLLRTSRWLVPAAAACVIIALAMEWWEQDPGLVRTAYADELRQIVANSEAAEWVHIRYPKGSVEGADRGEYWASYRPYRAFAVKDKSVSFEDGSSQRHYVYDIATRTITIRPLPPDPNGLRQKKSFLEVFQAYVDSARDRCEGLEIRKSTEATDDKTYDVFTVVTHDPPRTLAFCVDPAMQRIVRLKMGGEGMPAPVAFSLDYPETGPTDVYAMGLVPRDAKIIDLAQPGWEEAREKVEALDAKRLAARDAFAPTYYAIIALVKREEAGSVPLVVRVVYKKAGRYRLEEYGPGLSADVPFTDMEGMERWLKGERPQVIAFIDGDGDDGTLMRLSSDGSSIVKTPSGGSLRNWTVESLGWGAARRWQAENAVAFPHEFSAENGLVVRQHSMQGRVSRGGAVAHPLRVRVEFESKRDYLVREWEQTEDLDAPWQRDKDWLSNAPEDWEAHSFRRRHVKTLTLLPVKTPQGQWYPKILSRTRTTDGEAPSKVTTFVHLDTTREIPDGLLDPTRVTKDSFRHGS